MRSLAVARSFAPLLARSLAASRFEISAAVADARCPRPDRGPGTRGPARKTPRRSRSRSIDRAGGGVAEVSSTFHLDETRARTCQRVAEDALSLSADRSTGRWVGRRVGWSVGRLVGWSIDRSIESRSSANTQLGNTERRRRRRRIPERIGISISVARKIEDARIVEERGTADGDEGERKFDVRFVIDRSIDSRRAGRWMQPRKIAVEISCRHRSIGATIVIRGGSLCVRVLTQPMI